jgi:capsular exopolysaccharide synthesis family protein
MQGKNNFQKRKRNSAFTRNKAIQKSGVNHSRILIAKLDPKSINAEQYRTIRTGIQFSAIDQDLRKLVVTSVSPGEGKSTTIANLAIVFAQQGKKVVLIDADLRKPTVHLTFTVPNNVGLSNVLTNNVPLHEAMTKTDVDNLYVLPSGPIPPNPSELLGSKAMDRLIISVLEMVDIILFDAPPVLAVTDALVLSGKCDGTILVVKSQSTKKEHLKLTKQRLDSVQAKILGVVLNNHEMQEKYAYYY